MKTPLRWMTSLALLLSAAVCELYPPLLHADAPASLDLDGPTSGPISIGTGYFGSGHREPSMPLADSTRGGPRT